MNKLWIILFIFGLFSLTATAQSKYEVTLSGLEKTPQVRTPATGLIEVWFESDTLYVSGTFSDLRDYYWAGHIHYGRTGEEGNRLFRLKPTDLSEDKRSGAFDSGENKFHLRPVQREALRDGRLYINISSHRYQQGEIRGQIPGM
jgi:hypothetical protein